MFLSCEREREVAIKINNSERDPLFFSPFYHISSCCL